MKRVGKKTGGKMPTPRRRKCGTMSNHYRICENHPEFRTALHDLEHAAARRMASGAKKLKLPVTIPVVVHVVHKTPDENISAAQIRSQIKVLNKDYRAKNADKNKVPAVWQGLVTDAGVHFKLATIGPTGKKTTGITRTQTSEDSFSDDDTMKSSATGGVNPWPTKKYLNIWVCTLSGGLLGYAQFPGGPAATDGVVILNTAFGTKGTAAVPFNLGRTTTHEVGHWLNLRHIWGDTPDCSGGDSVSDTPNAEGPNFNKPSFPRITCGNGPNGDMFMNYMDYVDDDSMFLFTTQQVSRMQATLEGPRGTLIT